jgi:hypothetical protein
MIKFKVGDKLRRIKNRSTPGIYFMPVGTIVTVKKVRMSYGGFSILNLSFNEFDGNNWNPDRFEVVRQSNLVLKKITL